MRGLLQFVWTDMWWNPVYTNILRSSIMWMTIQHLSKYSVFVWRSFPQQSTQLLSKVQTKVKKTLTHSDFTLIFYLEETQRRDSCLDSVIVRAVRKLAQGQPFILFQTLCFQTSRAQKVKSHSKVKNILNDEKCTAIQQYTYFYKQLLYMKLVLNFIAHIAVVPYFGMYNRSKYFIANYNRKIVSNYKSIKYF